MVGCGEMIGIGRRRPVTERGMRPRRIVVSDPGSDDLPSLVEITSGDSILGIVSERDIVRAFSQYGQHLMSMFVKDIMQQALITVKLDDSLDHAMKVMTHYRVRHLPVVQNRKLVGIISIGDVVKNRLNDLQMEADILRDAYIARR